MNGAEDAVWQWVTNTLLLCAQQQTIQVSCQQHYTININNREKARCPEGDHSQVHELKMSPISWRKGEQGNSMALNSFLHKTNFTLREIISTDSRVWTDCQQEWERRDKHLSREKGEKGKRWKNQLERWQSCTLVFHFLIILLSQHHRLHSYKTDSSMLYVIKPCCFEWQLGEPMVASALTTGQFEPSNMKLSFLTST